MKLTSEPIKPTKKLLAYCLKKYGVELTVPNHCPDCGCSTFRTYWLDIINFEPRGLNAECFWCGCHFTIAGRYTFRIE